MTKCHLGVVSEYACLHLAPQSGTATTGHWHIKYDIAEILALSSPRCSAHCYYRLAVAERVSTGAVSPLIAYAHSNVSVPFDTCTGQRSLPAIERICSFRYLSSATVGLHACLPSTISVHFDIELATEQSASVSSEPSIYGMWPTSLPLLDRSALLARTRKLPQTAISSPSKPLASFSLATNQFRTGLGSVQLDGTHSSCLQGVNRFEHSIGAIW